MSEAKDTTTQGNAQAGTNILQHPAIASLMNDFLSLPQALEDLTFVDPELPQGDNFAAGDLVEVTDAAHTEHHVNMPADDNQPLQRHESLQGDQEIARQPALQGT
jgi:hypothetical protein